MRKSNQKKGKKENKIILFIIKFFLLCSLLTSAFTIYEILLLSSIENLIRFIVIGVIIFIDLILIVKAYIKKKKNNRTLLILFMFFYSIICFSIGGVIFYLYGELNSLNKNSIIYTSELIVMSSSNVKKITDVNDLSIGILSDKKNPEGYIIPNEMIEEYKLKDNNKIVSFDDYSSMINDLYAGKIDAAFVSNHYVSSFSGIAGYEDIQHETKVIVSKDKKLKKKDTSAVEAASSNKSISEPFTILLMGIDSTDEVLSKNAIANGDTLILITFNPKTLNATMMSIPRDSYVPIACWNGKPENKITHAAVYGNDCMINTIENYLDVDINYYAKVNFKGLVKLVNAVDGVEVNVEKQLCTDNSNREGVVCIKPGYQTLNGEEALVFARNRKSLGNGDFGRAEHQQELVIALINKLKTIRDVSKFTEILNTVSNSMDTNLTTKQILSFYNVGKDIVQRSLSSDDSDVINIQQLYLQGEGQMIYDERAKRVLWDYVPNEESRNDIVDAMKENLELKKHDDIKEFSFSINEPYEKEIIGKGPYKKNFTYTLLPDFTGDTEAQATSYAEKLGLKVRIIGSGGRVIKQSEPEKKRVDLINTITFTLSGVQSSKNKKTVKDDSDDKRQISYKNNLEDEKKEIDDDDDDKINDEKEDDDDSDREKDDDE